MENKRLVIYPFSEECMIFSKHLDLIENGYSFVDAAAPEIWETCGRKIMTSEGEKNVKITPSEFEGKADILLIPEFDIPRKAERGIVSVITDYIPNVGKVIYYGKLSDKSKDLIIGKCRESNCEFDDRRIYIADKEKDNDERLIQHNVPVIAVAGLWENTGKTDILLSLKSRLINDGYNVSVIGSRGYSDIFGCENFPGFMLSDSISERLKPLLFNRYIDAVINEKEPDIILVGVPGAMQMLTEKFTNGFGITPFIVLNSIVADYLIVCGFYGGMNGEFYEELSNMCFYRYGIRPDIYHMSDMYIDVSESDEKRTVVEHTVSGEYVNDIIKDISDTLKTPVMDLSIDENADRIYDMIIGKLTDDTRAVV